MDPVAQWNERHGPNDYHVGWMGTVDLHHGFAAANVVAKSKKVSYLHHARSCLYCHAAARFNCFPAAQWCSWSMPQARWCCGCTRPHARTRARPHASMPACPREGARAVRNEWFDAVPGHAEVPRRTDELIRLLRTDD